MSKKVYVGMSGGVDSSLSAALLKEQGYLVTGVYMKNWAQDLPGFDCPWRDDLADAKRVAVQLGIPFKIFDFQEEYRHKVVDYMLGAYKDGITPNPDIMCNQEIKFKIFLESALEDGADLIATGHYAQTHDGILLKAKDEDKDQTYFLYRVSDDALKKTLFPLGGYTKEEVRKMANSRGLVTANKKESMGICFVGKVGIKEFLGQYVTTEPGDIVDENGKVVGRHDGAIFYTIGQRHGLHVATGLPMYVVGKDMQKNIVFVSSDIDDSRLWSTESWLTSLHAISHKFEENTEYEFRYRHRGELIKGQISEFSGESGKLAFSVPIRALTPGQSIVIYEGEKVLGGGIVSKSL